MYAQDIIDGGINVTADVSRHSANVFQRMCQMCAADTKFVNEISFMEYNIDHSG